MRDWLTFLVAFEQIVLFDLIEKLEIDRFAANVGDVFRFCCFDRFVFSNRNFLLKTWTRKCCFGAKNIFKLSSEGPREPRLLDRDLMN